MRGQPVYIHIVTASGVQGSPQAVKVAKKLLPKFKGRLAVQTVDVESNQGQELLQSYGIQELPTFIVNGKFFKEGVPSLKDLEKVVAYELEKQKEVSKSFI